MKKDPQKKVIGFQIEFEKAQKFEELAKSHGASVSEFLRALVEKVLTPALEEQKRVDEEIEKLPPKARAIAEKAREIKQKIRELKVEAPKVHALSSLFKDGGGEAQDREIVRLERELSVLKKEFESEVGAPLEKPNPGDGKGPKKKNPGNEEGSRMTRDEFIEEASKGGPGLDGYAFSASVYCPGCGEKIIEEIADDVAPKLSGTDDPSFRDSEVVPQPIFFGEADSAMNCEDCGEYLYGENPKEDGPEEEGSKKEEPEDGNPEDEESEDEESEDEESEDEEEKKAGAQEKLEARVDSLIEGLEEFREKRNLLQDLLGEPVPFENRLLRALKEIEPGVSSKSWVSFLEKTAGKAVELKRKLVLFSDHGISESSPRHVEALNSYDDLQAEFALRWASERERASRARGPSFWPCDQVIDWAEDFFERITTTKIE